MNECLFRDILSIAHKQTLVNHWIRDKWKEKPLLIYGNDGLFKTSFAHYILKEYSVISINDEFLKQKIKLDEYLDMSLYKKSITMMFQKRNIYKSIIFDDLHNIQQMDKPLFNSIIDFSKKKITDHPIIYITSLKSINNKNISLIYKKCFPIHLSFTENQLISLVSKYLLDPTKEIDKTFIQKIVSKSYYNIHTIKENISFYKNNEMNIKQKDHTETNYQTFMNNLFTTETKDIYRDYSSDINVTGLNILENYCSYIETNTNVSNKIKIRLMKQIYNCHCVGDNMLTFIHKSNQWDILDHIINLFVIHPKLILQPHLQKNLPSIVFSKYISKCIIYIHSSKILTNYSINDIILSKLYYYLHIYLPTKKNKEIYFKICSLLKIYHIPLKVIQKYYKYFTNYYEFSFKIKEINILYNNIY